MGWLGYSIILFIHCILYPDIESKKVTFTEFSVKNNLVSSNHEARKSMHECLLQCERDKNCLEVKYTEKSGESCLMINNGLTSPMEAGAAIFVKKDITVMSSCSEAPKSGIYSIKLSTGKTMDVYCEEMYTNMWTVIQRRQDGSVNFTRDWASYKSGFGDLNGEFWLGNDNIHELTKGEDQKLRVDFEVMEGRKYNAIYGRIFVADESEKYRIDLGPYKGSTPPGDGLKMMDGAQFSTYDSDNDGITNQSCAALYKGGWWYGNLASGVCHEANPNGEYNNLNYGAGINWYPLKGYYYSIKKITLKIRKKD